MKGTVAYYYGDLARGLLLSATFLSLIASPLYVDHLRTQFIFVLAGAIITIIVASLTDTRRVWSFVADMAVAIPGFVAYTAWGFVRYSTTTWTEFIFRICVALLYVLAFYVSFKTVHVLLERKHRT